MNLGFANEVSWGHGVSTGALEQREAGQPASVSSGPQAWLQHEVQRPGILMTGVSLHASGLQNDERCISQYTPQTSPSSEQVPPGGHKHELSDLSSGTGTASAQAVNFVCNYYGVKA